MIEIVKNMSDLTIIIVNWNGENILPRCLKALMDKIQSGNYCVTIVDNHSSDRSCDIIRKQFPGCRLLCLPCNLGFARGNNFALANINTTFALFLNPDTIAEIMAIETMLKFLVKNPEIGLIGCRTVDEKGFPYPLGYQKFPNPITEFLRMMLDSKNCKFILNSILGHHDPNISGYVKKLYGGCLMARTDALKDAGFFDERFFMYGEDVDLCKRFLDRGWEIYYLASVYLVHSAGGASKKAPADFVPLMQSESVYKLMVKYYGKSGGALFKLLVFIAALFRIFLLLILAPIFFYRRGFENWRRSISKWFFILQWTIGIKRPSIP